MIKYFFIVIDTGSQNSSSPFHNTWTNSRPISVIIDLWSLDHKYYNSHFNK